MEAVSAFILAGGRSSRFIGDKSLFNYKGIPLIEHVSSRLTPLFENIVIIADDDSKYSSLGFEVYADIIPNLGPIGGIYTALTMAKTERAFIVACDMPFLNSGFIEYMLQIPRQYDVVIPKIGELYEPLHAVYSRPCLPFIIELIDSGDKRITQILEKVSSRYVTEDEIIFYSDDPFRIFHNINYRKDVEPCR